MFGEVRPDDYLGLPVQEATALATQAGWYPRVLTPDITAMTTEYVSGRLNLWVDADGSVIRVSAG